MEERLGEKTNHEACCCRKLRAWISKLDPHQPMPASQFTAMGRRGKDRDGQRRQGPPGPHGDAPASREGQGRGGRQGQVVRNLSDQFNGIAVGGAGPQGKRVQILVRVASEVTMQLPELQGDTVYVTVVACVCRTVVVAHVQISPGSRESWERLWGERK